MIRKADYREKSLVVGFFILVGDLFLKDKMEILVLGLSLQ